MHRPLVLAFLFVCVVAAFLFESSSGEAQTPTTQPSTQPTQPITSKPSKPSAESRPSSRFVPPKRFSTTSKRTQTSKARHRLLLSDSLRAPWKRWKHFLQTLLMKQGRDPNRPWLLAHTLLALGKDVKLADGRSAVERIVTGFVKFRHEKGKEIPYFPRQQGKTRIDPHRFLQLKTLLQVGVPLTRKFRVGQRNVTLQQLLHTLQLEFPGTLPPSKVGAMAWGFSALRGRVPMARWRWFNAQGQQVSLLHHVWALFRYTETQTQFLEHHRRRGDSIIPRQRQALYREACGGFHLLQASLSWMQFPLFRVSTRRQFQRQITLLFYRNKGERAFYQQVLRQRQTQPAHRLVIRLQQQKFLGHWLETIGLLMQNGWRPNASQIQQIQSTLRETFQVLQTLQHARAFRTLPSFRQQHAQVHHDLLGDAAHTLHALRLLSSIR